MSIFSQALLDLHDEIIVDICSQGAAEPARESEWRPDASSMWPSTMILRP